MLLVKRINTQKRNSLICSLISVSLFFSALAGCARRSAPDASATPARIKIVDKWTLKLLETPPESPPISLEVNSLGEATFRRLQGPLVDLKMELSNARLKRFDETLRAVPKGSWTSQAPTTGGMSLTLKQGDSEKGLADQPGPATSLLEALRELEPKPYSKDKEEAWICGAVEAGAERGAAFVNIARPPLPPVRYRLSLPANLAPLGALLAVTGKVDTEALDFQQGGVTYVVTTFASWGQTHETTASPTPSPRAAQKVSPTPLRKKP